MSVDLLEQIVKERQHQEVEGVLVDVQTANALLVVHRTLSGIEKESFEKLLENDIVSLKDWAWGLIQSK